MIYYTDESIKYFQWFYCMVLIGIIYSCNSPDSDSSVKSVTVDEVTDTTIYYSSFFKNFEIIPLEFTSEALIGTVSQIRFYENKFYILDFQSNSVLIFNNEGKLLKKLYSTGKGPGEFIAAKSIRINEFNKTLNIFDTNSSKILIYTAEGQYIDEIVLSTNAVAGFDFIFAENYFYIANDPRKVAQNKSLILKCDLNGVCNPLNFYEPIYQWGDRKSVV